MGLFNFSRADLARPFFRPVLHWRPVRIPEPAAITPQACSPHYCRRKATGRIHHSPDFMAAGVAAGSGTMNDHTPHITIGERHGWGDPQGFRKSQELFNIDRAIKEPADRPLVIVEGFFDAIKLHQHGCRKVVALMGSTMSAAQEALIREHSKPGDHIIVMLDENEAGRAGRDDIACRLSKSCFVRVHEFEQPDMEPEHLSAEQVQQLFL
jgi:5S rRNA maturation endonuclease (ribonuclease M5)